MKFITYQYDVSTCSSNNHKFCDILERLNTSPHACYGGTGRLLSTAIHKKLHSAPLLIVRSQRMSESWRPYLSKGQPEFTLDGLETQGKAALYWTWVGPNLTLSFKTFDVADFLCDAFERKKPLLVAWIVNDMLTVDQITIDQQYLDVMTAAHQARWIPRFIPDKSYACEKLAQLPPLLFTGEERYIAEDGVPAYIVSLVGIDREPHST